MTVDQKEQSDCMTSFAQYYTNQRFSEPEEYTKNGKEKMMQDYCLGVIMEPKEFYDQGLEIKEKTSKLLLWNIITTVLLVIYSSLYFGVYDNNNLTLTSLVLSCSILLIIALYTIMHYHTYGSFLIFDKLTFINSLILQYILFATVIIIYLCNDLINTYPMIFPGIALIISFSLMSEYYINIDRLSHLLIENIAMYSTSQHKNEIINGCEVIKEQEFQTSEVIVIENGVIMEDNKVQIHQAINNLPLTNRLTSTEVLKQVDQTLDETRFDMFLSTCNSDARDSPKVGTCFIKVEQ